MSARSPGAELRGSPGAELQGSLRSGTGSEGAAGVVERGGFCVQDPQLVTHWRSLNDLDPDLLNAVETGEALGERAWSVECEIGSYGSRFGTARPDWRKEDVTCLRCLTSRSF